MTAPAPVSRRVRSDPLPRWTRLALWAHRRPWAAGVLTAAALYPLIALTVGIGIAVPWIGRHPSAALWLVTLGALCAAPLVPAALVRRRSGLLELAGLGIAIVVVIPAPLLAVGWFVLRGADPNWGPLAATSYALVTVVPAVSLVLLRERGRTLSSWVALSSVAGVLAAACLVGWGLTAHVPDLVGHPVLFWGPVGVVFAAWVSTDRWSWLTLLLVVVAAHVGIHAAGLLLGVPGATDLAELGPFLAGPLLTLGALPFALVARHVEQLSPVPADHPLRDWRRA